MYKSKQYEFLLFQSLKPKWVILMFIDCHVHLSNFHFQGLNYPITRIIDEAKEKMVDYIVGVISNVNHYSYYSEQLKFDNIIHVLGIYSLRPEDDVDLKLALLEETIEQHKPSAIGELLYFQPDDSARQKRIDELLRKQIQIAHKYNLPIVTCAGYKGSDDFLTILKEEKADELGGQIHCCRNSLEVVKSLLDMGFYLSYGSPPSTTTLNPLEDSRIRELIEYTPLDQFLIETDSPCGNVGDPPKPRYTPAILPEIAENLAAAKNIPVEELAQITMKNAKQFFDF
ncbi:MAG: TatD family deoxyribonuclease [Asgard group archaeon]|nr:TatD family deoxyribonuclease [Asgard group archaeon]